MIKSIDRGPMLEALLSALENERYVRTPLLNEVIDELDAAQSERGLRLAKTLLERVDALDGVELKRHVDELRHEITEAA